MICDLQKASMWKRISAYIFDFILVSILAVGIGFLLSLLLGYDAKIEKMEAAETRYEEKYGIDFDLSLTDYENLTDAEKAVYEAANEEFGKDPEVARLYLLILYLTLMVVTFGLLGAYIVLDFLVPLWFKNGQTLGKKIVGIAVMRVDGVKISTPLLFVRTVLGKFTIETMAPVLLLGMALFGSIGVLGVVMIGLIGLLQIVALVSTKTNSAIHDLLSGTVTVDMASQMIFDTPEELIAYKKRIHAESVERSTY